MAGDGFDLPSDILVDILARLPTSARRRFRLVCKRWRDVIDERTPERQVRTKILVFKSKWPSYRALVFDDQDDMIGTCNGLICLLDSGDGDRAAITVANPITGEALALPGGP